VLTIERETELTNKMNKEKIPNEVIAVSAMNAVLKTEGVHDLAYGFTENLSKNLLGRDTLSRGIKISQEKEGVIIDVHVNVIYNVKIPIVAWDIQENVKKDVEKITEEPIFQVNIHVQGIGFDENESRKGII
jgi:uncharacterized alkaline shock family protein YloU